MLVTAVSEAVERYDPSTEAVILLETARGFQVLILSPFGWESVGGLEFGLVFCPRDRRNKVVVRSV